MGYAAYYDDLMDNMTPDEQDRQQQAMDASLDRQAAKAKADAARARRATTKAARK